MPFGLKNTAQAFQRLMDSVLRGVHKYINNILVASSLHAEHLEDLTFLFETLEANSMVVNKAKCLFGVGSISFLMHTMSADGIVPLPSKVATVRDFSRPEDVAGLQYFLGDA